MKSKRTAILWADSVNGSDFTTEKKWDKELANYADARAQGVQPSGTSAMAVHDAMRMSDDFGKAVDMSKPDLGVV